MKTDTVIRVTASALPTGGFSRPAPPGALSSSLTLAWRSLLKIKHVPAQLIDVAIHPVIFTLIFVYFFGGALAGSTGAYVQFLVPGILVMTVLLTTMHTGVALNTDITRGVFDRFRVMRMWRPSPLVGALASDSVRYLAASVIVLALGLALGFRPAAGLAGMVAAVGLVIVFCYGVAWIWTWLGLLLPTPQSVTTLSQSLLFLLVFASNTFVDPQTMPTYLRPVVEANPITHLVTAVRGLMDGTVAAGSVAWVFVASVGLTVVFGTLAARRYRTRQ